MKTMYFLCFSILWDFKGSVTTRFATASAGKTFVAAGILQLIEAGRLHFEDTIGTLLEFDLHRIDPDVTVRQLLNHTSGIPDYFDESVMDEYEALWKDFPNYKIRSKSCGISAKDFIDSDVLKTPEPQQVLDTQEKPARSSIQCFGAVSL